MDGFLWNVHDMSGMILYKEQMIKLPDYYMGPFLLTWFNFNPSMDK